MKKKKVSGETALDIIRGVFPDISEDEAGMLLWHRTGFPAFWRTDNPAQEIRDAMLAWKCAQENGIRLCDFCDREAVDGFTCKRCGDAIKAELRGFSQLSPNR